MGQPQLECAPGKRWASPPKNSASDLYDALFREYPPSQGRWITLDPAGMAAMDMTNPQTWNRYAYVANNPLIGVDPLGLDDDQSDGGSGGSSDVAPDLPNEGTIYRTVFMCPGPMCGITLSDPPAFAPGTMGMAPDPTNSRLTWLWNFTKALMKGPSTGSGSCVGLFTETVTAPLKQLQGAAKNYIPLMIGAMQSALP